jgi:hypothetical protein
VTELQAGETVNKDPSEPPAPAAATSQPNASPSENFIDYPYVMRDTRGSSTFLIAGVLFMVTAFALLVSLAYLIVVATGIEAVYDFTLRMMINMAEATQAGALNVYGMHLIGILTFFAPHFLILMASVVCIFTGIYLLRAAGAIRREVIPFRGLRPTC